MNISILTRVSAVSLFLGVVACSDNNTDATGSTAMQDDNETVLEPARENPFFEPSPLPLQYPPFDKITTADYMPAFEEGMEVHLQEIDEIVNQPEDPTFDNTIVPLELSGQLLDRVATVFFALSSADTNDDIDAIEVEISPKLSAHNDAIYLNAGLFARVKAIYDARESLDLDAESLRLVEEDYKDFVRAGALLDVEQKERLKAINQELAELTTRFSQNVLDEVNDLAVVVDTREELAGLTDAQIQAAADAAESRDMPGVICWWNMH